MTPDNSHHPSLLLTHTHNQQELQVQTCGASQPQSGDSRVNAASWTWTYRHSVQRWQPSPWSYHALLLTSPCLNCALVEVPPVLTTVVEVAAQPLVVMQEETLGQWLVQGRGD